MTSSSTSREPVTTPRTDRSTAFSICSESWTRQIASTTAGLATTVFGHLTGPTKSGRLRKSSTSSSNAGSNIPDLHVYHYNHYEPTALDHLSELHETREEVIGRLMGRFATREEEVDDLLRRRVFVDLYRVVRQGIRASVESYSLKRLEALFEFERQVALQDVNERMVRFEIALDDHAAETDREGQMLIQGYNEDDCRATLGLRDWLEERRLDLDATSTKRFRVRYRPNRRTTA